MPARPISRDRRSKTRRVQDAWEDLRPLVQAGYPLKDIWSDHPDLNISYRQFTRTIFRLVHGRRIPLGTAAAIALVKGAAKPPAVGARFDPLKNLSDHENRPKPYEYPGTRPAEELI